MAVQKSLYKLAASFFWLGNIPVAPGTAGSVAGFLILYAVHDSITARFAATAILLALAFAVCGPAERIYKKKDDQRIVIDEVCASMLVMPALALPLHWHHWAAGFIFFRIFDIIKPPPAQGLQRLNGSTGIILDDVAAAGYAHICVLAIMAAEAALTR